MNDSRGAAGRVEGADYSEVLTLRDVLLLAEQLPRTRALYAARGAPQDAELPVLVHHIDDVDDDDTDLPAAAMARGWDYVLSVPDVRGIVSNAHHQRPDASLDDLLVAFRHYFERDAFVVWD